VTASLAIVLVAVLTAVVWLFVRRGKAERVRSRVSEPQPAAEAALQAESARGVEPGPAKHAEDVHATVPTAEAVRSPKSSSAHPTGTRTAVAAGVRPAALPQTPSPSAESAQGGPLTPPAHRASSSSLEAPSLPETAEHSSSVASVGRSVRRRIAPEKRGGRPRLSESPSAGASPGAQRAARKAWPNVGPPRVDLVCRQEGHGWVIGVELNEPDDSSFEWFPVIDGIPLEERSGFYPLPCMDSPVSLICRSCVHSLDGPGSQIWSGDLSGGLLAFKLDAHARQGRRVRSPGRGLCLVVAPADWKRLGPPGPAAPEPVLTDDGYRAHYFDLDEEDAQVAFRRSDGRIERLARHKLDVRLEGPLLPDSSERMGPFFAPTPPVLSAARPEVWDEVATVVVGQEGPGRKRWRTHFHPSPGSRIQEMPPERACMDAGWFYVRFYSYTDDLIDSLDFRFASGLALAHRPQIGLLPGAEGHDEVCFILSAGGDWSITPVQPRGCRAEVDQSSAEITLTIPAVPEADVSTWQVNPPSGAPLPLVIHLDRVWWSLTTGGQEPRWLDKPLSVSRDWFSPLSRKQLLLKLPKGARVRLGFNAPRAHEFRSTGSDGQSLSVHLRDFGDSPELAGSSPASFRVWVSGQSTICLSLPSLTPRCRICDYAATSRGDMVRHARSHLDDLFPRLSWAEVLEAFPDRGYPMAIYKCGYHDDHIVIADSTMNLENATSAIIKHLENCPYAERDGGKVIVRFETISNVQRIREIMHRLRGENLPDIRRCRLCPRGSEPWEDSSSRAMARHLVEWHWDELWSYREE